MEASNGVLFPDEGQEAAPNEPEAEEEGSQEPERQRSWMYDSELPKPFMQRAGRIGPARRHAGFGQGPRMLLVIVFGYIIAAYAFRCEQTPRNHYL